MCFTTFKLLGRQIRCVFPCLVLDSSDGHALEGPTKAQFGKSLQNLGKPNFWSEIAVLLGSPKCTALAANFVPGPLQIICFTRIKLLGPQTLRVFPCLGPDSNDGQASHVPEPS